MTDSEHNPYAEGARRRPLNEPQPAELEDIVQPTEVRTQACPVCRTPITMVPYDIGSGPEMSCPGCEHCWGADGQRLKPLDIKALLARVAQAGLVKRNKED